MFLGESSGTFFNQMVAAREILTDFSLSGSSRPPETAYSNMAYMERSEGGENQNSSSKAIKMSSITNQIQKIVKEKVNDLRAKVKEEQKEKKIHQATEVEELATEGKDVTAEAKGDQLQRKTRKSCPVIGTSEVSFTLSEDLLAVANNIKFCTQEDLFQPKRTFHYTIKQRVEGWMIEQRERKTTRYDSYFFHIESQRLFRSVVEVTNFILYETYPNKPIPKPKKKKVEEGGSSTMPLGEESTPNQKKANKPRKNMENGEQGSAPVQRKVGRPRKVIDGEQMTSSVLMMRKPENKMVKNVTNSVPTKEEKLKGAAREMSRVINETMKPSGVRFMDFGINKVANTNYSTQMEGTTTRKEKRKRVEVEIDPVDEVMDHFQQELTAELNNNVTKSHLEGKENAIIHKAKGSVDKYNSKYLRDVLKSRMSDSQKESFLEEFYMVMTNKKETDGEEQNMYVGGIHGKKMKNPEPFLQYKPKTVCKSS